MSREASIEKLERILGQERASSVVANAMKIAGVSDLDDPTSRLRFGRALCRNSGVVEAIGRAISIQAILEGADESD